MKRFALVLIASFCLAFSGCERPKVTEPNPDGFKPVEALTAESASAGAKSGEGPKESEKVLPPQ